MTSLPAIRREIVLCQSCPRLRAYCARVAQKKRASFRNEDYWAQPVPGFGDKNSRVLVIGLAPGAHGANRTGRVFTGDKSGDFLINAMHSEGFANQPTTQHAKDPLRLIDAYLNNVVRCAPPDNKPSAREIQNCERFLEAELAVLTRVQVVLSLGNAAFDAYWKFMARRNIIPSRKPHFSHGSIFIQKKDSGPHLVTSYHPSQRNTNTGKITAVMLRDVFKTIQTLLR